MSLIDLIRSRREDILRIAASHGARNIRVFGSIARGEANDESDVDFLVNFDESSSLMDHAALLVELEELLGRKVDVAPEESIRTKIKERVMKDAIPL